jgi:hypothetical protein
MSVQVSQPSYSGRQSKANTLEAIATLRLLLDALEAVLRAGEVAQTFDYPLPFTPTRSAIITGSTTPDGEGQ